MLLWIHSLAGRKKSNYILSLYCYYAMAVHYFCPLRALQRAYIIIVCGMWYVGWSSFIKSEQKRKARNCASSSKHCQCAEYNHFSPLSIESIKHVLRTSKRRAKLLRKIKSSMECQTDSLKYIIYIPILKNELMKLMNIHKQKKKNPSILI